MVTFSLLSAIGIGIGILITSQSETGPAYYLTVGILQALAGGTIIYVVVFEILERERSKNISGLLQLIFVVIGFCCLLMVEIFGKLIGIVNNFNELLIYCFSAGHDHDHEHEHEDEKVSLVKNMTEYLIQL